MLGQYAVALDEAGEAAPAFDVAREAWAAQSALPAEQQAANAWVAGVLGVMLFERGDDGAGALLDSFEANCNDLEQRTGFTRRVCIARAVLASDVGRCATPAARPPSASMLAGRERDWWAGWWLLRARCDGDAAAPAELSALATDGELPAWLATRLAARAAAL